MAPSRNYRHFIFCLLLDSLGLLFVRAESNHKRDLIKIQAKNKSFKQKLLFCANSRQSIAEVILFMNSKEIYFLSQENTVYMQRDMPRFRLLILAHRIPQYAE